MDLNLDWMTLDDFQKHLNGEDEILSGPPLSPSEYLLVRPAIKFNDLIDIVLINIVRVFPKHYFNLQEVCDVL